MSLFTKVRDIFFIGLVKAVATPLCWLISRLRPDVSASVAGDEVAENGNERNEVERK